MSDVRRLMCEFREFFLVVSREKRQKLLEIKIKVVSLQRINPV